MEGKAKEREGAMEIKVKEVKEQSIPSMVDGLKPVQRKILFCGLEHNLVTEIGVYEFMGHVLSDTYNHGGLKSVVATIIGMAQDFVGSNNNINLLDSGGQIGFGCDSRYNYIIELVPKAWQMDTKLTPIARFLFPKDDDKLLNYLNENGKRIEPTWYTPVIPMVLVNGTKGFGGKGSSTFVPSYNPRDLCANVRRLLRGQPMVPIDPWYKGFRGTIEKTTTTIKESGGASCYYTVSGIIEQIDETTLRITELPPGRWPEDYKQFLNNKIKETFIKDYRGHGMPDFKIIMSKKNLRMAKEEGLMKKFKLTTTISTSNMHLFDSKGVIKKYDNPEQILEEFFYLRLELYEKRKEMLLSYLELKLHKLLHKLEYTEGCILCVENVENDDVRDVFLDLKKKGLFTRFQKMKSINEENSSQATVDSEENEEQANSFYKDLLSSMIEKKLELRSQKEKLTRQVNELRESTPEDLWMKDLDALDQKLDELDIKDARRFSTGY